MKNSFTRFMNTLYRFLFEIKRELQIIFYPKPEIITRFSPLNKKVVYTTILGNYDNLKEPEIVSEGWDYICFTDREDLRSDIWKIVLVKCPCKLSLKRCSAFFALFPFNYLVHYELSIYINGTISIFCDLNDFLEKGLPMGKVMAIMKHPKRGCTYKEAEIVKERKKDSIEVVDYQMNEYKRRRFPVNFGLCYSGIMIRRHNDPKLTRHCRLWLKETLKHSQRDQVSLMYILWKYKLIDPGYISRDVFDSGFRIHKHNYSQQFN
jgi:hypothetical protein